MAGAANEHRSKAQNVLRNIFSIPTLMALLGLLGLEALSRQLALVPDNPEGYLEGDPFLLWEMPPGVRPEVGVVVHVNSMGLRGPEIVQPKPTGTKRIYTLGDSSIYGFGVADEEVFHRVAAQALGPSVEGICGGVGGYSTVQALRELERKGPKIQPDLLVVGTLWSDNMFDSFVDKELLELYSARSNEEVNTLHKTFSRSELFRTVDWYLRGRNQTRLTRIINWMQDQRLKTTGRRRVAVNDYAQNLEAIVTKGLSLGAESFFLMLANRDDLTAEVLGERPWAVYRKVMRDTAARHGAQLLEVGPLFKASGLSADELFLDAMHPSPAGHRIIGTALAERLSSLHWPSLSIMAGEATGAVPVYEDTFLENMPPNMNHQLTDGGGPGMLAPFGGVEGFIAQADRLVASGSRARVSSGEGAPLTSKMTSPGGAPGAAGTPPVIAQQPMPVSAAAGGPEAAGFSGQPSQVEGQTLHQVAQVPSTNLPPPPEGAAQGGQAQSAGPSPLHGGPAAPLALHGTLISSNPLRGPAQIDVVSLDRQVLGSTRLLAPGSFTLATRAGGAVFLQVIVDVDNNGPSGGDPLYSFAQQPLHLDRETVRDLIIDLEKNQLSGPPAAFSSPGATP